MSLDGRFPTWGQLRQKDTPMIQADALRKLLSTYDTLNKTRPAGRPHGFSDPEVVALVTFLTDHEADYVSEAPEAPKVKVPNWYAIDQTSGTVTSGAKKMDLLGAWMVQYAVPPAERVTIKFLPPGTDKKDAKPGMNAYSYSHAPSLLEKRELLLVPGAYLEMHLGAEKANKIRASAGEDVPASGTDVEETDVEETANAA